ncbi:MAG: aminoacyl-tRNA hydrolase [Pseudomonadota bacterium]
MWLVVGLGNPGSRYARNRHNIGFMVVDELASRHHGEGFRAKFGGEVAAREIAGTKVLLVKPLEFMNVSGRAVQRALAFYGVDPSSGLLVAHDDIDLDLGRLKIKTGGGHGGHNGLRSIIQDLGSADFVRVRCGVGRPPGSMEAADYVLADFPAHEREEATIMTKVAADAVEAVVRDGAAKAMNAFNVREAAPTK